ncbi:GTP-binding protein [Streptomyces kebangsaanensis]|uniref:GTP-binding protein n=1 Tax=Streptomyces kebangsaanensis TaxID=864058 RepID=UPI0009A0FAF6|nr:GTP-binding protein [Streptomyces kebangsaanensis]
MAELTRAAYASLHGPTTGDRVRPADTDLWIEGEEDRCFGGDEAVFGGGDVARKGGPGIAGADLLIVNKTDLAPHVGVDVDAMVADARSARDGLPVLALSRHDPASIAELADWVRSVLARHRDGTHVPTDPGPMAPHSHAHHHDS